MAKKLVNVVYKVDDKELQAVKGHLQTVQTETKKSETEMNKLGAATASAGKAGGESFLNLKNILAGISVVGLVYQLGNLSKKILELGINQEQLNIAFTTFLGSAEKAKKLIGDLTQFSIVTPFTPDQVNKAAKSLLAFGVEANKIIPTLKFLGDVSAGTGKDLAEMAVIFGQIRSTGRLMGQDLLQLINAGFNPLQVISQKTGRSVGALKKDMENGLITFDMVEKAFVDATSAGGLFFNLMDKQSQSVGGKLSTVAGNIDEIGKALYSTASGPLAAAVDELVKISAKLLEMAQPLEVQYEVALKKAGNDAGARNAATVSALEGGLSTDQTMEVKKKVAADQAVKTFTDMASGQKDLKQATEDYVKILEIKLDREYKDTKLYTEKKELLKAQIAAVKAAGIELQNEQLKQSIVVGETSEDRIKRAKEEGAALKDVRDSEAKQDAEFEKLIADQIKSEHLKTTEETYQESLRLLKTKDQEEQNAAKMQADALAAIDAKAKEAELEREQQQAQLKKDIRKAEFNFAVDAIGAILVTSMKSQEDDLTALNDKYQRELDAAGNNEKAKKQIMARQEKERQDLQRKQAAEAKQQRINTILAESLVNAVKALGLPPIPGANFFAAGSALAYGVLNAGLAATYKDGEVNIDGPGTSTSDSIVARISKGESVINAPATQASMNLLEAINERKIDDRILHGLAANGGSQASSTNIAPLLEKLDELKQPTYASQGYTLMEQRSKGQNFKLYIRSKVQGY